MTEKQVVVSQKAVKSQTVLLIAAAFFRFSLDAISS